MADPQFEQFREVFDRLPQHIKAPTYCYRLSHDIVLDSPTSDDNSSPQDTQDDILGNGHSKPPPISNLKTVTGIKELAHFSSPVWKETNWTNNACKDGLPTLQWISSTNNLPSPTPHTVSSSSASLTCQNKKYEEETNENQTNGRKRRRLPEIPKDKPAFSTSIVFKTRALSLAEEIFQAENPDITNVSNVPTETTFAPNVTFCTKSSEDGLMSSPKHSKRNTAKRLFPFGKCRRFEDDDSSPEEKILNIDIDSGNSTGHSPDGAKSFSPAINGFCCSPCPTSPASSSGVSTTTLESLEATHRGLHKFVPRHHDEVELEIGDPLYIQKEADDLWCEGINLRTGKSGIFPSAYVTDVEYEDFDPETVKVKKERFLLKFLGSIEVNCNKGNDVLCQAIRKITGTKEGEGMRPHPCVLEISDQGLRMVDKRKPLPNNLPCHDYFFFLKNISFCGFHPNDYRYFGFITKHPTKQRFACHVFIGDESTRPVAEAVGRAFQRFYHKFIETAYPIEDIYLE